MAYYSPYPSTLYAAPGAVYSAAPSFAYPPFVGYPFAGQAVLPSFPTVFADSRGYVVPTKPKLTYFNGRGRAELIRLIFAVAGVEYEDIRFKPNADADVNPSRMNDEFAEFKKSGVSVTGQVPFLEIDGMKLVQSMAICRYLAVRYGLCGNGTEKHRVEIDMIVDTAQDLRNKYVEVFFEKDESRKQTLSKEFWETIVVKYGEILEKFLDKNEIKSGYFVGDRLSWADLVVYDLWSTLLEINADGVKAFSKLGTHTALIKAVPLIAAWIAKRPATPF